MKKYIILSVFSLFAVVNKAQTPRYVNLELMGVYNLVGVSFDSRFSENSKFGYKVGLGYGYEKVENGFPLPWEYLSFVTNAFSLPVNAYYLFGKSSNHFETGLGVSIVYRDFTYTYADNSKQYDDKFGYLAYVHLGYRFESSSKPWHISAGFDFPFKTPNSLIRTSSTRIGDIIEIHPSISVGYRL